MHPEYLYNNDTQDISRRVSELAASNEPALCAHCQEVSRQTDTSSLSLAKDCADRVNDANATLSIIGESLQKLTKSLLQNAGVFRTQNGKKDFSAVCRAVTQIEEARRRLLAQICALSAARSAIALAWKAGIAAEIIAMPLTDERVLTMFSMHDDAMIAFLAEKRPFDSE